MCVCAYIYIYIYNKYMYVCIHIYIYIHIHIHINNSESYDDPFTFVFSNLIRMVMMLGDFTRRSLSITRNDNHRCV